MFGECCQISCLSNPISIALSNALDLRNIGPIAIPQILTGCHRNKKTPSSEGADVINLLSKSGAEGQSLTDTGSPPPVFESGANYIS